MPHFLLPMVIGTVLGAALGYFGPCGSGTCPLTATWWRGAMFGALFGFLVAGAASPS